ncbi:MAG: addiction module protein [Pyrinomonadaceae bacterium]
MTVQTIPTIEEMTPGQRVELMQELWKVMSQRPEDIEVPEWHLRVLEAREQAVANGEDEFIDLDVAMAEIRARIDERSRPR